MKITIENIGVFRFAEYELADLTIMCGRNNTGKTYATYSLYGFIDYFRQGYQIKVSQQHISTLIEDGSLILPIDASQETIDKYLEEACEKYKKFLPMVFAAQKKYFEDSRFCVKIDASEIVIPDEIEFNYRITNTDSLVITKYKNRNELRISFVVRESEIKRIEGPLRLNLAFAIGNALKNILFNNVFKECYIASAERTGAVIFKEELNFNKNTILREIATSEEINIDEILDKIYNTHYALPVRRNINFIKKLESISKDEGKLAKENPELIDVFNSIVGGEYKVTKEGVYYCPETSKNTKLTIGESASSVRSLLDFYFYLKYVAKSGDMLMIDEPELNLHPESQRKLAKLLVLLVNKGVRVFITTHSDYIIREFNTLLMFYARKENGKIKEIMHEQGYSEQELLSPSQVKMFISDKKNILLPGKTRKSKVQTLIPAEVDPEFGIEAISFDDTINKMNFIQKSIMYISYE